MSGAAGTTFGELLGKLGLVIECAKCSRAGRHALRQSAISATRGAPICRRCSERDNLVSVGCPLSQAKRTTFAQSELYRF
jgi:hypothetical protein